MTRGYAPSETRPARDNAAFVFGRWSRMSGDKKGRGRGSVCDERDSSKKVTASE